MAKDENWSVGGVCKANRKLYVKTLCMAVVGAMVISFSIPRTYVSRATISIDINDKDPLKKGNFMENVQSMFSSSTSDVLSEPQIYMNIMKSNSFKEGLLHTMIYNNDENVCKTYAEYLDKDVKNAWWNVLWGKKDTLEMIEKNIKYELKLKTGLIVIQVSDQDANIANAMTDTVVAHLHRFMTEYMTNKATIDLNNKANERRKAASDYHAAMEEYTAYANANTDISLPSENVHLTALQNEVDQKLSLYNEATQRWKMAQMELQRMRPTFFKIVTNTVAVKPSNPKWVQNIFVWVFYAMMFTTWYVLYRKRWDERMK